MKKLYATLLSLSLLTSCATPEEKMQSNFKQAWSGYFQDGFNQTKTIDVLVVTNRKSKNSSFTCNEDQFGVVNESKLQFGLCQISVPKNHVIGAIPFSKDGRQSSHEYFKVLEAKSLKESDLIDVLKSSTRTPLVFVHGFNVKYQEAVLRASQIAYDLKYQGPIVLFTWPAGSGDGFFEEKMLNKTYENNMANAKNSIELFKNFMRDLADNDVKVNLVIHSMGHQVVLPALKQLSEVESRIYIKQLILNAPDFDAAEFKTFAKSINKISNHTTLYCSTNDKAMIASKTFNKNERLGACIFSDDFDTINVSLVDDPALGLGHGYYSSRPILNDLFQTLIGIEAEKRLFIVKSEPNSMEKYFLRN
ncbi:MAG: alpha/beta hydrolase [Pseudomonadota bacterium]